MSVLEALFALIAAIPILDRWLEALSAIYRQWKFNRDEQATTDAFKQAETEGETEALQEQIGREP